MDDMSHHPRDTGYQTPTKHNSQGEPFRQYLTPYFSSKLKGIASKIKANTCKRFRFREEAGEEKLVFWSELKQISEASKTKESTNHSRDELTPHEIDAEVRKKRIATLKLERSNFEKRSKVNELLKAMHVIVTKNRDLRLELRSLKRLNCRTSTLTSYAKFLKQKGDHQLFYIHRLNAKIHQHLKENKRINNCLNDIPVIDHLIQQKTQIYDATHAQLLKYTAQAQRLAQLRIPNSMINCMFLVGILNEQIYIIILQRKERTQNKAANNEKTVNRSFKLHQKLAKREIHIQCNNSCIVQFNTFIAIYMHCKSLTLSNIIPIMNSLSFFSEDFKQLYHYHIFEQYVHDLIDQFQSKAPIAQANNVEPNDAQTLKKRLVIVVRKQYEQFLRLVLAIFSTQGKDYCINFNSLRMILEVSVEEGESVPNHEENDLPSAQFNELRIHFHNFCPSPH